MSNDDIGLPCVLAENHRDPSDFDNQQKSLLNLEICLINPLTGGQRVLFMRGLKHFGATWVNLNFNHNTGEMTDINLKERAHYTVLQGRTRR